MRTTQVTASDKRPCGLRSQRNLHHAYRHLIAGLVFALPTHVVVTWYSHGFGRNHRRNRDSVLSSAYLPDGSEALHWTPEFSGVAVENNAAGA
jgi:hypothetical protein